MFENDVPTPRRPVPMHGPMLKQRLNEIVTPRLARFGVDWLDDYRWVQPGNTAIRRIVKVVLMKGAGAIMSWGYSFSFVPVISGQRLTYHRTQKSAIADLFELESSYVSNIQRGPRYGEFARDAEQFEAKLDYYLVKSYRKLKNGGNESVASKKSRLKSNLNAAVRTFIIRTRSMYCRSSRRQGQIEPARKSDSTNGWTP